MNQKKCGLHLENWQDPDLETYAYLDDMDPAVIVVMGTISDGALDRLAQHYPHATVIGRMYDKDTTVEEAYWAATLSLWYRLRQRWPNDQIIMQLYNEPNIERFGQSAEGIWWFHRCFEDGFNWLKSMRDEGQPAGSEMRIGFTPMAPGNKDFLVVEDEPGTVTYIESCADLITRCDAVFLHIYGEYAWQAVDPWFGGRIEKYQQFAQGKPIYITESAFCAKEPDQRAEATVRWFKEIVIPNPQVKGVAQWIGNRRGNGDPAWDGDRHFDDDGNRKPVANAIIALVREPDAEETPIIEPPISAPANFAVDISNYTGELSPSTIDEWRTAGVSRVIVRASTEDSAKVAIARQQMQAVIDAGLELQAYCWIYFDPNLTGDSQMAKVLETYGDLPIGCFWIDCEDTTPFDASVTRAWIVAALADVMGDANVGIYTSRGWWTAHTENTENLNGLPLWDANWTGNATLDNFVPYGGWTAPAMVQYAADVMLGGVKVDLNVYANQAAPPAEETTPNEIPEEYRQWGNTWEEIAYHCRQKWVEIDGVATAGLTELRSLKADILERAGKVPDW